MLELWKRMKPKSILALGNFFAGAHFYLIEYILTPYLATLMPADTAALSVALGAIITLSVFPFIPRMVVRHGPQRMAIFFAGVEGLFLLLLSTPLSALGAVGLIALACSVPPFIVYQLDLLLEACVEDEQTTGRVRTAFNTASNAALILSPLVVGLLLDGGDRYGRVFFVAALSVIPFILLMFVRTLPRVHPPGLRSLRTAAIALLGDKDRRAVALSNLVMQCFFHLVPLYVPLYLHIVLGIPWSSLGWVFAVSLIPFVIFEYPAGWLADTKLGDTVLLATGFVIGGLSLVSLTFVHATTPLSVILIILVVMRIGGALIEAMTESHFFRRVSSDDVEAVSIFRMMRPVGALTAPIIGSILLSASSYSGLFIVSGFGVLIAGVVCAYLMTSSFPPILSENAVVSKSGAH